MTKSKIVALRLCGPLGTIDALDTGASPRLTPRTSEARPRKNRYISRIFAIAFFVLGIGAKDCANFGGQPAPPPAPQKPFCLIDPPLGCAAFCEDVDVVTFTPQCRNVEASDREIAFELNVMKIVQQAEDQGTQACPQANSTSFLTPCKIGISPVEHPNQDHEVCTTPPLNCPL